MTDSCRVSLIQPSNQLEASLIDDGKDAYDVALRSFFGGDCAGVDSQTERSSPWYLRAVG